MAEELHHIKQIFDSHADLVDYLDNDQIAIETDTDYLAYRDDDGVYHQIQNKDESALLGDINCDDLIISTGHNLTIVDFTLGSVLFAGNSGLISQDNANFFWNDSDIRLGLGTNAPVSILELKTTASDPVLTISAVADGGVYNPQIQFRYGATPAVGSAIGLDSTDASFRLHMGTGTMDGSTDFVFTSDKKFGLGIVPVCGFELGINAGGTDMGYVTLGVRAYAAGSPATPATSKCIIWAQLDSESDHVWLYGMAKNGVKTQIVDLGSNS